MPKKSEITNVTVAIGSGLIGQAIARRVSTGRHVLLAETCAGKMLMRQQRYSATPDSR